MDRRTKRVCRAIFSSVVNHDCLFFLLKMNSFKQHNRLAAQILLIKFDTYVPQA